MITDVTGSEKPEVWVDGPPPNPESVDGMGAHRESLSRKRRPAAALPSAITVPVLAERVHWRTRLFSLATLAVVGFALGEGATTAYHAFRDSFVAPIVLSPDSDTVMLAKQNLLHLEAEQRTISVRVEESRNAIKAADEGIAALNSLKLALPKGMVWSREMTSEASQLSKADLATLKTQEELLARAIADQEAYLAEMRQNMASGLVRRADLAREEMELGRLRVAALQRNREFSSVEAQRHQASLTSEALQRGGSRVLSPELLAAREESVRIDMEIRKLEVEKQAKDAELRAALEDLAKMDEMVAQMKTRPIFRATAAEQTVAFVPYTQIEGVLQGAPVYKCAWWGMFLCGQVGSVLELVKGEVVLQDSSGTPARGQYAVLHLTDSSAAKERLLRVRQRQPGGYPTAAVAGFAPSDQAATRATAMP